GEQLEPALVIGEDVITDVAKAQHPAFEPGEGRSAREGAQRAAVRIIESPEPRARRTQRRHHRPGYSLIRQTFKIPMRQQRAVLRRETLHLLRNRQELAVRRKSQDDLCLSRDQPVKPQTRGLCPCAASSSRIASPISSSC